MEARLNDRLRIATPQRTGDKTAVQQDIMSEQMVLLQVLLETGANVNMKNDQGLSALHIACHKGHEYIVDVLLKTGADPLCRGRKLLNSTSALNNYGRKLFLGSDVYR